MNHTVYKLHICDQMHSEVDEVSSSPCAHSSQWPGVMVYGSEFVAVVCHRHGNLPKACKLQFVMAAALVQCCIPHAAACRHGAAACTSMYCSYDCTRTCCFRHFVVIWSAHSISEGVQGY